MSYKFCICFMVTWFSLSRSYAVCNVGQSNITITIIADSYPNEISWTLRDGFTNALIDSGGSNNDSICIPNSQCAKFTIHDAFGDGICCSYGNGSYTVSLNDTVVAFGGNFRYSETTFFNCPPGHDCSNPFLAVIDTMTAGVPDTWYIFSADTTGLYEISSCGLGNNCDTKIYIYDHCNSLLFDESNIGTTFYDDDGCGIDFQSKISARLTAGSIYYIRIGDMNTACAGQLINWQIKFMGAIHGCMDPASCNYSPLATVSDSSCIYFPNILCSSPDLTVDGNALESSMYMDVLTASQSNCYISEGCLSGYGDRRIIRFTTHIRNIGTEDYYIGMPDTGNQFVLDACHGHWHYNGYAEYLVYDRYNQPLQQGFKNGFCVMDLECSGGGVAKFGCGNMGISAGCGDIYSAELDCQWIDVTDLDTGNYTLVVRVNWDQSPDRLGHIESTFTNNWAQVCFHLYYDAGNYKVFSLLPDCNPYVDCTGDTFGIATVDCMENCNGSAVRGDLNTDVVANDTDVDLYLEGIKDESISRSSCNDLNGDSLITVTDAARLNGCLLHKAATHQHTGSYQNTHHHCDFPFNIYNPFDSINFSIADIDSIQHYIDLSVYNPTCPLLAYEFKLQGLIIDSIRTLAVGSYTPDLRASATGHVVAISADENSLSKQLAPLNFIRVFYNALIDTQICISEIIAVNSNYEEVRGKFGTDCIRIAQPSDTIVSLVNLISSSSLQVIPATGTFEIYLQGKSLYGSTVTVFDAMGKKVYSSMDREFTNHYTLDLSNHESGIYLLQMNVDGSSLVKRIFLFKK
jgi:hypothetical protein